MTTGRENVTDIRAARPPEQPALHLHFEIRGVPENPKAEAATAGYAVLPALAAVIQQSFPGRAFFEALRRRGGVTIRIRELPARTEPDANE